MTLTLIVKIFFGTEKEKYQNYSHFVQTKFSFYRRGDEDFASRKKKQKKQNIIYVFFSIRYQEPNCIELLFFIYTTLVFRCERM